MSKIEIEETIDFLSAKKIENMYLNDFFLTWDKTEDEIAAVFDVADILRQMRRGNISSKVYDSGLAVSIFRDKSTRTRFSFAGAADLLGLALQDLDEERSQITHGETVRETANMISFLTEVIGIRDDIFLGEGHTYMKEVSKSVQQGYEEGVLPQRPTIVNLQCDIDHPTQTMADALYLSHCYGGAENLRGKKIAMTWAYSPSYGKPLSVPQGVIGLMTRFGMDVVLAYPEGYSLIPEVEDIAKKNADLSGGAFTKVNSMQEAFKEADIVYPKSWAPYEVMKQRTPLLKDGDRNALEDLEKQCLENNKRFMGWECTEELMETTKDGKALYMHCLPADISSVSCEQGEVAATVFDRYRVSTYLEAGYKPYIIAAMIVLSKFEKPDEKLRELLGREQKRVF